MIPTKRHENLSKLMNRSENYVNFFSLNFMNVSTIDDLQLQKLNENLYIYKNITYRNSFKCARYELT